MKQKMENRKVGYLIVGIAIVIGIIVFLFNTALKQIVAENCSHGITCAMYGDIRIQTIVSLVLLVIIAIIGLVLIFNKEKERIIIKNRKVKDEVAEAKKEEAKENLKLLNKEEKILYNLITKEGSMFQADLVDKSQMGKVKVSRLLDGLEGKNIIERKRRGMNNIVILK